jgi:FtsH-binding integral membrane protein
MIKTSQEPNHRLFYTCVVVAAMMVLAYLFKNELSAFASYLLALWDSFRL